MWNMRVQVFFFFFFFHFTNKKNEVIFLYYGKKNEDRQYEQNHILKPTTGSLFCDPSLSNAFIYTD